MRNARLRSWPLALGAGLVVLLAAGCRDTRVEEEKSTAAFERMEAIGAAYRKATARRGSPPRSAADLRAFCPQGLSPEEFLVSPGDGETITVFWGTDPNSGMDVNPLVLAHERTGGRRGRLVLTSMGVLQMPAEVFAKARFPTAAPPAAEAAR